MIWKCSALLLFVPLLQAQQLNSNAVEQIHFAECTDEKIDVFVSRDILNDALYRSEQNAKKSAGSVSHRRHQRNQRRHVQRRCLGALDPIALPDGTALGFGGSIEWSECASNFQSHITSTSGQVDVVYKTVEFVPPPPFNPIKVTCRCHLPNTSFSDLSPPESCRVTFQFDNVGSSPQVILDNDVVLSSFENSKEPQAGVFLSNVVQSVEECLSHLVTIELLDVPTTNELEKDNRVIFRTETIGLGRKFAFPNRCGLSLGNDKPLIKEERREIDFIRDGCPSSKNWDLRIDSAESVPLSRNESSSSSSNSQEVLAHRLIISFSLPEVHSGIHQNIAEDLQLRCEMELYDDPPVLGVLCPAQSETPKISTRTIRQMTRFRASSSSSSSSDGESVSTYEHDDIKNNNIWSEIEQLLEYRRSTLDATDEARPFHSEDSSDSNTAQVGNEAKWRKGEEVGRSKFAAGDEGEFTADKTKCHPDPEQPDFLKQIGLQQVKVDCREQLEPILPMNEDGETELDEQIQKILGMYGKDRTRTSTSLTGAIYIDSTLPLSSTGNAQASAQQDDRASTSRGRGRRWKRTRYRRTRHLEESKNEATTNRPSSAHSTPKLFYSGRSLNASMLSPTAVPVKPQWVCLGSQSTSSNTAPVRHLAPDPPNNRSSNAKFQFRNYVIPADMAAIELQEEALWSSTEEAPSAEEVKTSESINIVTTSDADVDSEWEAQLYDRKALRKPGVPAKKNRGILGTGIGKDVPLSQSSIYRAVNMISYGPWITEWARDKFERTEEVQVGNDRGFVEGGVGAVQQELAFSTGWRNLITALSYNEIRQEVGFGLALGPYGVNVDRSQNYRATAVEVLARGVEAGTLIDFVDRNFGQRLKVRNFEISIRHDFDDFFYPTDTGFGTEVLVAYRGVSAALASDVREKRLGVTVGVRGYNVAILHDFDNFLSLAQANWGRGWQLAMESDFPDEYSLSSFVGIGFGRLNRVFGQVGFGIGDDGVPQASARVQTRNVGLGIDFLNEFGQRVFQYAVTVGRFTYVWQVNVDLTNVRVPNILGIQPAELERFLLSLIPKRQYSDPLKS